MSRRSEEYRFPVNHNQWSYTTSKRKANLKVKRARRKQIRQYLKKELQRELQNEIY